MNTVRFTGHFLAVAEMSSQTGLG